MTCNVRKLLYVDFYISLQVTSQANVKILTFESPLYFANAELFINKSYQESGIDPVKIKRKTANIPKVKIKVTIYIWYV